MLRRNKGARPIKTELIQADEKSIFRAAKLLQVGELVAMPTETVYGLAANAFEPQSILKIFEVKGLSLIHI